MSTICWIATMILFSDVFVIAFDYVFFMWQTNMISSPCRNIPNSTKYLRPKNIKQDPLRRRVREASSMSPRFLQTSPPPPAVDPGVNVTSRQPTICKVPSSLLCLLALQAVCKVQARTWSASKSNTLLVKSARKIVGGPRSQRPNWECTIKIADAKIKS